MSIVEERVMKALDKPMIYLCASGNAKSERMMYINWIRQNNLVGQMTVMYRQDGNRVIVGPKDFNLQCYVTDYDLLTQEELDRAWENRTQEAMIPHEKQRTEQEKKEAIEERNRMEKYKDPFALMEEMRKEGKIK